MQLKIIKIMYNPKQVNELIKKTIENCFFSFIEALTGNIVHIPS